MRNVPLIPNSKTHDSLGSCRLFVVVWAEEDTEHQGYKSQQGHAEAKVGHVVLPLRLGQPVRQSGLQAHKQHAGGEGDTGSHVVKNFGVVHLSCKQRRAGQNQV